jgi:hypothetical protein
MTNIDSPENEPNKKARLRLPAIDKERAKWAYAKGPNGEMIFRNWYFIITAGALTSISVLAVFSAPIATLVTAPFIGWVLWLEWHGVQLHEGKITYPVRLGLDGMGGILPLFNRTLDLAEVSNATTTTIRTEIATSVRVAYRIAYLTGEFGTAKIVFDTKGGRDRLFAIIRDSHPHITVHRWT